MEDGITYDVRVYRTEVYKGAKVTTYWVRWKVGGEVRKEPFVTPRKLTASAARCSPLLETAKRSPSPPGVPLRGSATCHR